MRSRTTAGRPLPDRGTRYELLAQLMSEAARLGVTGIGFVSTPTPASAFVP